jgi:hypothetical protein
MLISLLVETTAVAQCREQHQKWLCDDKKDSVMTVPGFRGLHMTQLRLSVKTESAFAYQGPSSSGRPQMKGVSRPHGPELVGHSAEHSGF